MTLLRRYAEACGWALARAHARSGDAAMISGYMGSSGIFDDAICDFAVDYADQAERDHKAFVKAVREGRVKRWLNPKGLVAPTEDIQRHDQLRAERLGDGRRDGS